MIEGDILMILQTKNDILEWLKQHDKEFNPFAYEIIYLNDLLDIKKSDITLEDIINLKSEGHQFIFNYKGDMNISDSSINEIPFKIHHVSGSFNCGFNQLSSLRNGPDMVNETFYCAYNQLTTLQYAPKFIKGSFNCSSNKITNLQYCPAIIDGYFICVDNMLNSLEFFPEIVKRDVLFMNNSGLIKYLEKNDILEIDFFKQKTFNFWHQLHVIDKIERENSLIHQELESINFNEKKHHFKKI